jgi:hypothetical protein
VATRAGSIAVLNNRAWSNISSPLSVDDNIVHLVGAPGRRPVGVSESGAIVEIGAISAKLIERPPAFEAMEIQALGTQGGRILMAMGQEKPILAEIRGRLRVAEPLWHLAAGDRIAVIAGTTTLLIATERGQIRQQTPSGSWADALVSPSLPPAPLEADGRAGPARSR